MRRKKWTIAIFGGLALCLMLAVLVALLLLLNRR